MSKERTLFIELFQPFAQYRNPFTFYYAQSYPLPPKSTIIGMLQNVTGDWYGRNRWYEDEKGALKNIWWDDLKVSLHGEFESIFWNYQSLIKGDVSVSRVGLINKHVRNPLGGNLWHHLYHAHIKAQRTPVYQQELFNGHLFIFLRGNNGLLEKIKKSLEKPEKVLSLGRSEDIVYIQRVEYVDGKLIKDIEGDIRLTYPTYIKRENFPIKNQKYPVYSIPVKVVFKNDGKPVKHKAEITKSTERDVKFETVIYTGTDYSIILKDGEKIDVEIYEINRKKFLIIDKFGWL